MATLPRLPPSDPAVMTRGARAFIIVVCLRNLALGVALLTVPDRFLSPAFSLLSEVPLMLWGGIMLATGLVCAVAVVRTSELVARVGVSIAAATSLVWAVGYGYAVATVPGSAPTGAIVFTALAAKDYIIAGSPMALPFDTVLRRAPYPRTE